MRTYKTEGIVLKRTNYGEADRILTIYTKNYGKIKAMAKGIRKITSRKAGSLEPFTHTVLFLAKGKNLDIITETQSVNAFKSWRSDLNRVGVAYYFCELVDKLTPEEQENYLVFEILKGYLARLKNSGLRQLVRSFEEELLIELGFGIPEILKKTEGSLKNYIETITEKSINSPKILKQFNE